MSAVIYMPVLGSGSQVAFGIIFYTSEALVICLAFIATYIDPADPLIKAKTNSKEPYECEIGQSICTICNSTIGSLSKHCGTCNKCIDSFDHHCKWLNNCIGVRNYKFFIALLWSLEINTISLIIFAIVLFSECQNNYSDLSSRVNNASVYIAFVSITFIDAVFVLIGNTYLICFHSYLKIKGISTFDLILIRREKKEKKEAEEKQKEDMKRGTDDIVIKFED